MRSRRRTRHRQPQTLWYLLIAVSIALLAGSGIVFYLLTPPAINTETLCPEKTGPEEGLVILLDLTDSIKQTQHSRLREILDRKIADTPPNTLIAVGAVKSDATGHGTMFKLCKPLEGRKANEFYQNPKLVDKRYKENFLHPFNAMLKKLMASKSAQQSPIMESLQATLAETPGFLESTYPRRIIIVSDLIQHSATFSFYRRDNWQKFEASPDYARLARNLDDVHIEIYRLPRPEAKVNMPDVDDFWVNYLEQSGVHSIRVSTIGDL